MGKLEYIRTLKDVGEELENYIDEDGEKLSTFGPISRVNILVGATNSGKSRFMRGILRASDYVILSFDPGVAHPSRMLNLCKSLSQKDFRLQIEISPEAEGYDQEALAQDMPWLEKAVSSLAKRTQLVCDLRARREFLKIRTLLEREYGDPELGTRATRRRNELGDLAQPYQFTLETLSHRIVAREWLKVHTEAFNEEVISSIQEVLEFIGALPSPIARRVHPQQLIYIPTLRTAVSVGGFSTSASPDELALSVAALHNLNATGGRPHVFTGTELYWTITEERGSDDAQIQKRLRDFQRFLGRTFFEGASISLVPILEEGRQPSDLGLLIDEQIVRRFQDLGDGIQAIIILMYKLFTAEPGAWFFIEEPEQGLHPGLQRIFLETLAQDPALRDKDLTIFFSTHSNHLLGMALSELEDVSVFAFQRWPDPERFEIRPVHTRQESLLSLLGVANSSVFLANCGIWVEGITDRKYLRAFLSAYLESDEFRREHSFVPQEDVHYAFFEYAGSNLAHYLFELGNSEFPNQAEQIRAQFLCNRIFLLADQDEDKEEKHQRLKSCQSDSFQYVVTPGVEVENLISESQLTQALSKLIPQLPEEEIDGARIQFSDYRDERIGRYLKHKFGDLCPDALSASSGALTVYYKGKLASLVCPNVTWNNISQDARDLTKNLYRFIYAHNRVSPHLT